MRHVSRTRLLPKKIIARISAIVGTAWVIFGLGFIVFWSAFLLNSVPVRGRIIRYEKRITVKGISELVAVIEFTTRDGQIIQTEFGHSSDLTSTKPLPFEVDLRYTSTYPYQISLVKPTGFYIVGICILCMGLGMILLGRFLNPGKNGKSIR